MRSLIAKWVAPAALIVLATPALGQAPSGAPESSAAPAIVFGDVKFKVDKNYADLGDPGPYYPDRAMRNSVRGFAILACHVGDDLHLNDCKALIEKPRYSAFNAAALRMAQTGWMTAAKPDADQPHTTDGWVPIRVVFNAP